MTDNNLLHWSESEFNKMVLEALEIYKRGDVVALATCKLVDTMLISPYFLADETVTTNKKGVAMGCFLEWSVNKLQANGEADWVDLAWRDYNILYYYYFKRLTWAKLAEKMAVDPNYLSGVWRKQAVENLAQLLYNELQQSHWDEDFKLYSLANRYGHCLKDEQMLLRFLAIFRRSIDFNSCYDLAAEAGVNCSQKLLTDLESKCLLIMDKDKIRIKVEMRSFLISKLSWAEGQAWYKIGCAYYKKRQNHLEHAYYLQKLGQYDKAAEILADHYQSIVDEGQQDDLEAMLSQFNQRDLSMVDLWERVNLVLGRLAELGQDMDTAIEKYQVVILAKGVALRAEGLFRRAEAFKYIDVAQSLKHYEACMKLLEKKEPENPLLIKVYIDYAWLHIQERDDLEVAEVSLRRAQELLNEDDDENDKGLWSDWHNAWAMFHSKTGDKKKRLEHLLEALMAAEEAEDVIGQLNINHNLGLFYVWDMQDYERGLWYLEKSRALAKKVGNRRIEGLSCKTMGNCYFFKGEYEGAVRYGLLAYAIFKEMGNLNWLGQTAGDLAEAYAYLGQEKEARFYFREAENLEETVSNKQLSNLLRTLKRKDFPHLFNFELNERQKKGVAFVKEHGSIKRKEYCELNGCSAATATRDLGELVEQGILRREKGWRYIMMDDK